jgi:hypothetical protein
LSATSQVIRTAWLLHFSSLPFLSLSFSADFYDVSPDTNLTIKNMMFILKPNFRIDSCFHKLLGYLVLRSSREHVLNILIT